MSEARINQELRAKEDKLRSRYSKLSFLFLLIAIVFILVAVVVFLGVTVWDHGYNWAGAPLGTWLYVVSGLLALLILLNLYFYLHFSKTMKNRIEEEKPKPEYINGKRVHVYTHPTGKEGGIFSKTYIEIDKHHILRLRSLMIPPEDLWSKKEEKQ